MVAESANLLSFGAHTRYRSIRPVHRMTTRLWTSSPRWALSWLLIWARSFALQSHQRSLPELVDKVGNDDLPPSKSAIDCEMVRTSLSWTDCVLLRRK